MKRAIRQRVLAAVLSVLCIINTGCGNSLFSEAPTKATTEEAAENAEEDSYMSEDEVSDFSGDISDSTEDKYNLDGKDAFYILPSGTKLPEAIRNFKFGGINKAQDTVYYAYQILYDGEKLPADGLGGVEAEGNRLENESSDSDEESEETDTAEETDSSAETDSSSLDSCSNYASHKDGLSGADLKETNSLVTILMSYNFKTGDYCVGYSCVDEVTVTPVYSNTETSEGQTSDDTSEDTSDDTSDDTSEDTSGDASSQITGYTIERKIEETAEKTETTANTMEAVLEAEKNTPGGHFNASSADLLSMYLQPVQKAGSGGLKEDRYLFYHDGFAWFTEGAETSFSVDTNERLNLLTAEFGRNTEITVTDAAADQDCSVFLNVRVEDKTEQAPSGSDNQESDKKSSLTMLLKFYTLPLYGIDELPVISCLNTNYETQKEKFTQDAEITISGVLDSDPTEEEVADLVKKNGFTADGVRTELPDQDGIYRLQLDQVKFNAEFYKLDYEKLPVSTSYVKSESADTLSAQIRDVWQPVRFGSGSASFTKDGLICLRPANIGTKTNDENGTSSESGTPYGWAGEALNQLLYVNGTIPGTIVEDRTSETRNIKVTWQRRVSGGESDGGGSEGEGEGEQTETCSRTYSLTGDFMRQRFFQVQSDVQILWVTEERSNNTIVPAAVGFYRIIDQTTDTAVSSENSSSNSAEGRTDWSWDVRTADSSINLLGASGKTRGSIRGAFSQSDLPVLQTTGTETLPLGDTLLIQTDKMLTLVAGVTKTDKKYSRAATGKAVLFLAADTDLNLGGTLSKYAEGTTKPDVKNTDTSGMTGTDAKESEELSADTKQAAASGKGSADLYTRNQVIYPETDSSVSVSDLTSSSGQKRYWIYLAGTSGILKVDLADLVIEDWTTNINDFPLIKSTDYNGIASESDAYHKARFGAVTCLAKGSFFGIWMSGETEKDSGSTSSESEDSSQNLLAIGLQNGESSYTDTDAALSKIYTIPLADGAACRNYAVSCINKDSLLKELLNGESEEDSKEALDTFLANAGIQETDSGYEKVSRLYNLIRSALANKKTAVEKIQELIQSGQKFTVEEGAEKPGTYVLDQTDQQYLKDDLKEETDTDVISFFLMAYAIPKTDLEELMTKQQTERDKQNELLETGLASSTKASAETTTASAEPWSYKTRLKAVKDLYSLYQDGDSVILNEVEDYNDKFREINFPVTSERTLEQAENQWSEELSQILDLIHSPDDLEEYSSQMYVKQFAVMGSMDYSETLYNDIKTSGAAQMSDEKGRQKLEERMVQEQLDAPTMNDYLYPPEESDLESGEITQDDYDEGMEAYEKAAKKYETALTALKNAWITKATKTRADGSEGLLKDEEGYGDTWNTKWQEKWEEELRGVLNEFK